MLLLTAIAFIGLIFRPSKIAKVIMSTALGSLFALFAVAHTTHVPTISTIDTYANGNTVTIHGIVAAEPDKRPIQIKYTIDTYALTNASGAGVNVQGRVLITDKRMWPEFEYGDQVTVYGMLERPGLIDESFYYDRYLSRFGIYAVMYRGSIKKVVSDKGLVGSIPCNFNPIICIYQKVKKDSYKTMFATKSIFESQINKIYSEPYASFMAGLLTGSRRGIPADLMEKFNITGLTHIIAISGYNITIVITIISGMLFWLPFRWRFIPAVVAIVLFTLFVGASSAVVRASIMGILGLLALHSKRQSHIRLTVLWTLFFMLVYNPKYLWYDAGFQLSFLAVIGLMELGPLLDRFFTWCPTTLSIREALQMTMAAQFSAVPLIILLFGRLSLIAPLANVLVAPFIPLAMLFGFAGTMISFVYFPLGQLFAYIGWGCLEWIILVTEYLSIIPYASVDIPQIGIWMVAVYYVGLIAMITYSKSNQIPNPHPKS